MRQCNSWIESEQVGMKRSLSLFLSLSVHNFIQIIASLSMQLQRHFVVIEHSSKRFILRKSDSIHLGPRNLTVRTQSNRFDTKKKLLEIVARMSFNYCKSILTVRFGISRNDRSAIHNAAKKCSRPNYCLLLQPKIYLLVMHSHRCACDSAWMSSAMKMHLVQRFDLVEFKGLFCRNDRNSLVSILPVNAPTCAQLANAFPTVAIIFSSVSAFFVCFFILLFRLTFNCIIIYRFVVAAVYFQCNLMPLIA